MVTSIESALHALEEKGLNIENFDMAINIANQISPFHLEQYGLQFFKNSGGRYKEGSSFEQIYENYCVDRSIKNFLFDYLSYVEVKLRNVLSSVIQDSMGNYGYLDKRNFKNPSYHENFINEVNSELDRANEPFVKKELEKYNENLPIYMVTEIITFGGLSRLYSNLREREQKMLVRIYGYPDHAALSDNLDALGDIRNTCAHHGRLAYRNFKDACYILNQDRVIISYMNPEFIINPKGLFANILCMVRLLCEDQARDMLEDFSKVFNDFPDFDLSWINFPRNWEKILYTIIDG